MKVFAKYVTVEAVHDKQVLTFLFLDFSSKRDCLAIVKSYGNKPLKSVSGSESIEMELEDINAEVLKCEFGAKIAHDVMYDPDRDRFTDEYKEKESNTNG